MPAFKNKEGVHMCSVKIECSEVFYVESQTCLGVMSWHQVLCCLNDLNRFHWSVAGWQLESLYRLVA